MNDSKIISCEQLEEIVSITAIPEFTLTNEADAYTWIAKVLDRFVYFGKGKNERTKKEKILIRRYIKKYTAYSKAQITRLVKEKKETGTLLYGKGKERNTFKKVYTKKDVELLAEADNVYKRMSGDAMRVIFQDEYLIYNKIEYEHLSKVSHGQLYRMRATFRYQEHSTTVGKTQSVQRAIGIRKKPQPDGKPGFLRVDTVHQGDFEGVKGVYHINIVDEVTHFEILWCVEDITEATMARVFEETMRMFPFTIINFHSDNGGENINKSVAKVLGDLLIEQTKSRSGRCNDNALVESKNCSVVRKHMGHWHIPKYEAREINAFYRDYFNEFVNYHRVCAFPTIVVRDDGKKKKVYKENKTPIQKLLSIPDLAKYLRAGVTVALLEEKMRAESHIEFAQKMDAAKQKLFKKIKKC